MKKEIKESGVIKKILLGILGTIILIIGIIMLVTPGPAIIFIPLGLAILASEFKWFKELITNLRFKARNHKRIHTILSIEL